MHTHFQPQNESLLFESTSPQGGSIRLILTLLGTGCIFFMFPLSLWNTKPDFQFIFLLIWMISLGILAHDFLSLYTSVKMTTHDLIVANRMTGLSKSIRFDEVHSFRIDAIGHRANHVLLSVRKQSGDLTKIVYSSECNSAFIEEMGKRGKTLEIYQEF